MARRKTGDKKVAGKNDPAANREVKVPNVQADDHSIAFEELHVSGNVGGDIRIGHTIGYTADQVSVLLKQITNTLEPKKFDGRCPYKGLEVFEEEDAELFFGRERLVNELVGRVKESRTVFITGPSGSGKSSLVRAGLIHALKQGAIKSSERWLYETMKPGREPIKDLALAFSRLKSPELEDYFLKHAGDTDILNKCAESVLSGRKDQRFVLFVDQFEEVFTQISGEEERVAFINMLAHAGTIENGRVIVLFAMRSDFVSNCATYPALNEMLSQEFRQIGAMQPEELVSAIALPARHVGLPIEDELIARIINDMKGEPGALPLMQFALKDLFDSQQEKGGVIALRLDDYLKHGGIHKSLERHADSTFAKLNENEQTLARSIFSGLIEIGRGTQDTKRTALFDELIPANAKAEDVGVIVQKLADARLIITDEQAGKDTVTISHEKLIEAWPWLKKLVNENRDAIALQNEIASDAKEWEDHNRDVSYLYSGVRLANVREQLDAKKLVLSETSHEFVKAGRTRQQRSQGTLIAGISAIIVLLLVAVIVFSNLSVTNANTASTAQAASTDAVAQKGTAQAASTLAVEQAEEAQKQTNIALARQLVVQAQSANTEEYSNKLITALLAIKSMQISPSADAGEILQKDTLAQLKSSMTTEGTDLLVTFSPDGKYFVSTRCSERIDDDTCLKSNVNVWETTSGTKVLDLPLDRQIISVGISVDNNYLALGLSRSLGYEENLYVLNIPTEEIIAKIFYDGDSTSVALSPNGRYLVAGDNSKTQVLDLVRDREIAHLQHENSSGKILISPNGKYFAIPNRDNTINITETASGKGISKIEFTGELISFAFSSDGKYIATGGCNKFDENNPSACVEGSSHIFDVETDIEIAQIINSSWVGTIAFSPNNKYAVFETGEGFVVWDVSTGKELSRIDTVGGSDSLTFSPNGQLIMSGGMIGRIDDTAQVWDWSTKKEIARVTYARSVLAVAFSSDGQYAMSAGCEKTNALGACIQVSAHSWKPESAKEVLRINHEGTVWSVGYSTDGKYIITGDCIEEVVFSCLKGTARIWETGTGKEIARMTHNGWVNSIAISPDRKKIVSAGSQDPSYTVIVWDAKNGNELARTTHDNVVTTLGFSPDGNLVVSGSYDGVVRVWEANSGRVLGNVKFGAGVGSVAFDPTGKYIAAAGCDQKENLSICREGSVRVWEAAASREIVRTNYGGSVLSVAFSPNGKYVISGGCDKVDDYGLCIKGMVQETEIVSGNEIMRASFDEQVNSVVFSADGKHIAASGSLVAQVWETETGKVIAQMNLDNLGLVAVVSFSPDGKYIATHIFGGTARIRIWEIATAKEISRIINDNGINSFAFSPDGKYIVIGSSDRTTGIWKWQPDDLIADACSRVTRNLTRAEWEQYISNSLPYQAIFPNLPIELDPTPTAAP